MSRSGSVSWILLDFKNKHPHDRWIIKKRYWAAGLTDRLVIRSIANGPVPLKVPRQYLFVILFLFLFVSLFLNLILLVKNEKYVLLWAQPSVTNVNTNNLIQTRGNAVLLWQNCGFGKPSPNYILDHAPFQCSCNVRLAMQRAVSYATCFVELHLKSSLNIWMIYHNIFLTSFSFSFFSFFRNIPAISLFFAQSLRGLLTLGSCGFVAMFMFK